jgi:hypothetical protein
MKFPGMLLTYTHAPVSGPHLGLPKTKKRVGITLWKTFSTNYGFIKPVIGFSF